MRISVGPCPQPNYHIDVRSRLSLKHWTVFGRPHQLKSFHFSLSRLCKCKMKVSAVFNKYLKCREHLPQYESANTCCGGALPHIKCSFPNWKAAINTSRLKMAPHSLIWGRAGSYNKKVSPIIVFSALIRGSRLMPVRRGQLMMARCDVLSVWGKSAAPCSLCCSLPDKLSFVDFARIRSKASGTY